jgi:hypothetical protein
VAGGDDDSTLKIGRSYAKIIGDMPHAVMGGSGWAADADLVGGTAHIGDIVPKQLPCQGTDGQTRTKALASATIPGVSIGGLQGRANGRITKIGRVRAWTEGSVAHVALGSGDTSLTIDGVVGRVNLVTDRRGRLVRRDTAGTRGRPTPCRSATRPTSPPSWPRSSASRPASRTCPTTAG